MRWLIAAAGLLASVSCVRTDNYPARQTLAWVPIYASASDNTVVKTEASRATENPGKIYVYQQYIFQNEQYKGIHIINNADPLHPAKTGFISIPFNTEMAVRNGYIYANSLDDLVVLDITNLADIRLVNRIPNAFPLISQTYPPDPGYFVCPDPDKGIVVEWKQETVATAACRR